MEKITRTLTVTTVQYSEAVVENGVPTFRPCADEPIPGECNDTAKLLQYLQKKYGAHRSFLITGMSSHTQKYEMDLATFIANATPVSGSKETASNSSEPEGEAGHTENAPDAQPVNGPAVNSVEQPAPVSAGVPAMGQPVQPAAAAQTFPAGQPVYSASAAPTPPANGLDTM